MQGTALVADRWKALLGSLLALIALIYLYNVSGGSFSLFDWYQVPLSLNAQVLIFLAFFAAFAVKVKRPKCCEMARPRSAERLQ